MTDGIKIGDLVVWKNADTDYKKGVGIVLDINHRYYFIKWSDKANPMLAINKDFVVPAKARK